MINYFPSAYFDETLYSQIARYHQKSGNTCITHTNQDMFNGNKIVISDDFPSSINRLVKNLSFVTDISSKDIVENCSIIPLFRPFWTEERVDEILKLMYTSTCRSVHLKAGINGSMITQWEYFRYCPECISSDQEKYGEAYWHRLHQIPCVLICPTHKKWLRNSEYRKFEINADKYYSASDIEINSIDQPDLEKVNFKHLAIGIAEDIQWLLLKKIQPQSIESIKRRYLNKMKELGLVSCKGRIDQKSFVQEFTNYFKKEFLTEIGLLPDIDNTHNWISMMLRKYDVMPHPIKHILLIRYLYGNVKEFFTQTEPHDRNLFGMGPFPCLNAASSHFLKNTINNYELKCSRNNNKYGIFTCNCGFSYIRNERYKQYDDKYKYSTINKYGAVWEFKLVELIETKHLHLRTVAKQLNVDLSTIRKQVARLNLNTEYMKTDSKKRFMNKVTSRKDPDLIDKVVYRQRWLELIAKYPDYSKTRLKKECVHTFNWLNYHDKDWFLENSREIKRNYLTKKIDWSKRDEETLLKVSDLVKSEQQNCEKPCRITKDKIGDRLGILYLFRNNIDKLPKTKVYLLSVIEARTDFQKRKIEWVVDYLINHGEEVKEWRIRQLAGLTRVNNSEINKAIIDVIIK